MIWQIEPMCDVRGGWLSTAPGCVDLTQLDLPPTPEEVYEQFILLPIPGLGLSVQPPDLGLVNLPEIYYTADATTGDYTVDIRGYTVVISTYASAVPIPGYPLLVDDPHKRRMDSIYAQ